MPSPGCEVRVGSGAYQPTTNGVDVTPASTVTIRLAATGAQSWAISCVYTDELSDAAAINASLTINQTLKTATFVAPAEGRALIFRSLVDGGYDGNGVAQPSYATTFGIYTRISGRRVHAVNETFESDATYGYIADINSLIRAGGVTGTGSGEVTVGAGASLYITDGVADEVQINAAIAALSAAGGGVVRLLPGLYFILSPIVLLSNVVLKGSGPGSTRVVATLGFSNTYKWMVVGMGGVASGVAMPLAADAAFAAQSLNITASAETAAIAAGDFLFLRAHRDADPIVTASRRVGEFVKVLSVSGSTIELYNTLRDSYATADTASAYRVSFVQNCGLRDIEFYQADALGTRTGNASIVRLTVTRNASVYNCLVRQNDGPGIVVSHSLSTDISENRIRDLTNKSPAFGYGIIIGGASQGFVVDGNRIDNVRHAIDAGPQGSDPTEFSTYGIPRGGVISNNVAEYTLAAAYTTHSDAESWLFTGNVASNCVGHGFYMRGRGMSIHGNKVVNCSAGILVGDTAFYGSGGSGAGSSVKANTVRYIKKLAAGSASYTAAGISATPSTGDGIIIGVTDNVTVEGNTIEYTDGAGIVLKKGASRNIFRNNDILNANLLNSADTVSGSAAINIDNGYRGTGASLTMSGTTATVTPTGGTSIDAVMLGRKVHIVDSVNPANNGAFTVTYVDDGTNRYTLSGTQVVLTEGTVSKSFKFTNALGVNEAGTIQYAVEGCTDNYFEDNFARNTVSSYEPNSTGHAKWLISDLGITGTFTASSALQCNRRNVFKVNTGLDMETGLLKIIDDSDAWGNSNCESIPVKSKAGVPIDADFYATPPAGSLAQDVTTGRLYVRGSAVWEPVSPFGMALTSAFTTTLATSTDTALSFPVKNGEAWAFEFYLSADNNNTGGIKYQISGPAGTLLAYIEATSTTATSVFRQRLTAVNTLNVTATQTFNPGPARVQIKGVIVASADGTVALGVASGVAGQTTTIAALSSGVARKVQLV